MNALIGDIATTISIIIVAMQVTAVSIVVIVATCKLAAIGMLTATNIFGTFPADFIASFVKNGLINSDENFLHD